MSGTAKKGQKQVCARLCRAQGSGSGPALLVSDGLRKPEEVWLRERGLKSIISIVNITRNVVRKEGVAIFIFFRLKD
jgi:hypothetical protein